MRFVLLLCCATLATAWATEPGFVLRDLDGSTHELADYRGRWVVINYWATWCPPCLEEMPELEHFQQQYESSGATVLGINLEEIETEPLREFVDKLGVGYPILLAGPRPPVGMPAIRGLPTTYIVSPDGAIVETRVGPVTSALLAHLIESHGGELESAAGTPTP